MAGLLIYVLQKDGESEKRKKPAKKKTVKSKKTKPNIGWKLPKGLPRNMSTVKIIAEERIDLVVKIVKLWLKETEDKNKPQ